MPDRRTFLKACGGVAAAPALAPLAPRWEGNALPAAVATLPSTLPLKIDGWEAVTDHEPGVWVQINSSWRANWR